MQGRKKGKRARGHALPATNKRKERERDRKKKEKLKEARGQDKRKKYVKEEKVLGG